MNAVIKEYAKILDVINSGRPDVFKGKAVAAYEEYRQQIEQLLKEHEGHFKKMANSPTLEDIANVTSIGRHIEERRKRSVARLSVNLLDYFFFDHAYEHCNGDFFEPIAAELFREAAEAYENKQVQIINN